MDKKDGEDVGGLEAQAEQAGRSLKKRLLTAAPGKERGLSGSALGLIARFLFKTCVVLASLYIVSKVLGLPEASQLTRVWDLISRLEDPLGRLVNQAILALFGLSLVELSFTIGGIVWNEFFLKRAKQLLTAQKSEFTIPSSLDSLLQLLGLKGPGERSLVAQRVKNLFHLRLKGVLDVGVMKEITGVRVSLPGGFSRFVAGSLTVLGLVGTVLGLSLAVRDLAPVMSKLESVRDMTIFSGQMLKTLAGMETAFSCTLTGLICALVLSLCNFVVQRAQTGFYGRLEEFSNYELVPAIVPVPADQAAEEFARRLETAGAEISNALTLADTATQRYVHGASAMTHAASTLTEATQGLRTDVEETRTAAALLRGAAEQFVAASQEISRQNAQQVEQWSAVSGQLRTTVETIKGQVDQIGGAAQALRESTTALQSLRDLPLSLQKVLAEAMTGAVDSAQKRQEEVTKAYLKGVEEFFIRITASQQEVHKSYSDLIIGVQQSIDQSIAKMMEEIGKQAQPAPPPPARPWGRIFSGS